MQNKTEPSPRLRWYQYRLRTMLIIMTLFAVWLSIISHRARQQKQAVEKIRALGGFVRYDYQKSKGSGKPWNMYDDFALLPGPQWLRNFLGEDFFQNAVCVDFEFTAVTDDDLAILKNLPDLEIIDLGMTKISSNGLAHLEGMRKIKGLYLDYTQVDDKGLEYLKYKTDLRSLSLGETKITDIGMATLENLTNLEELKLPGTQITDESLRILKNFRNLNEVMLSKTSITEQGLQELKKSVPSTNITYTKDGEELSL